MAYQYPPMGGMGAYPGMNNYPGMNGANPAMGRSGTRGGGMPQGYGGMPGGYPAYPMAPQAQPMPMYGQGAPGMPGMQGPQAMPYQGPMPGAPGAGMPQMQGRSRRQGIISKMASQQQQPAMPQGAQMPQMGGQSPRRGLNLGRRNSGMGGGMPQMQGYQMQGMQSYMQQPMQPGVSPMGKPIKPKQFTLNAPGGAGGGTGVASLPDGNNLSLVANNLPDPATFAPGQSYVAYLTNRKGQGSFALGPLMAIGGGTYKLNFNSPAPIYDYDQVVISLENPYSMGNTPSGQVVLASSGGAGISLPKPVRNFFGGVWRRVKGAGKGIGDRIGGKKKTDTPEVDLVPSAPGGYPGMPENNQQFNLTAPGNFNLQNNLTAPNSFLSTNNFSNSFSAPSSLNPPGNFSLPTNFTKPAQFNPPANLNTLPSFNLPTSFSTGNQPMQVPIAPVTQELPGLGSPTEAPS